MKKLWHTSESFLSLQELKYFKIITVTVVKMKVWFVLNIVTSLSHRTVSLVLEKNIRGHYEPAKTLGAYIPPGVIPKTLQNACVDVANDAYLGLALIWVIFRKNWGIYCATIHSLLPLSYLGYCKRVTRFWDFLSCHKRNHISRHLHCPSLPIRFG